MILLYTRLQSVGQVEGDGEQEDDKPRRRGGSHTRGTGVLELQLALGFSSEAGLQLPLPLLLLLQEAGVGAALHRVPGLLARARGTPRTLQPLLPGQ